MDRHFAYISMVRLPGYLTYSERMANYPGFVLNQSTGIIENVSARVLNLDQLLSLLKSKDLGFYEQNKTELFCGQPLHTSGTAIEQQSIVYTTFPRSGNTMLRKYLETITGVATGSDCNIKFGASMALQFCDFKAEGICDERVWIKKSHYPLFAPFTPAFQADYALICTRNPLDIAPSHFFNMFSQTHVGTYVKSLLRPDIVHYWTKFVKRTARFWARWHQHWLAQAAQGKPIFFFRYEDLTADPRKVLS